MDSATHRIIWWIAQFVFVILIHWIAIYPVGSDFQRLSNWGLFYCSDSAYSIDAISFILSVNLYACFSLAHKHKHKDIRTRRMAYLTQFSILALLNPMINKMADEASAILLLICSHEVWVKVAYDWSMTLCLCLCLCQLSFHWSKLRHKHKHKHKKNRFVRFPCAYAYVDPVFTCLHTCFCFCLCASENQAL